MTRSDERKSNNSGTYAPPRDGELIFRDGSESKLIVARSREIEATCAAGATLNAESKIFNISASIMLLARVPWDDVAAAAAAAAAAANGELILRCSLLNALFAQQISAAHVVTCHFPHWPASLSVALRATAYTGFQPGLR